ncbi:protein NASP homolog [Anopheles bellator]|uniref:protein NASP homolog n=1 Tax=Anopheles bellator TaxID=139047 RepID=UPI002648BB7A|nr:protein NASP homolog [Anopheles bellator]XP_058057616.1 protein NASP homolog [Anopheles bellator]XP_058057617.1 protein NASP homolog [Anopheles bellator]XP_058057618.1 protein NASP homolog [Anopheles bellator]XP_058057621.1 protein NASP homolog [Anopheles bellator]
MAEKSETLVTKEDKVNDAKELFGRGSRNYCMRQYSEAADDLSSCCALYSEMHGSLADECGLPYLLYAKSLIAIGKDENNLIVPGEDEEEDDDDDEEGAEEEEGPEDAEGATDKAEGSDEAEDGEDQKEGKDDEEDKMDAEETPVQKEDSASATEEKKTSDEKKAEEKDDTEKAGTSEAKADKAAEPQPGPSTSNGSAGAPVEVTEDSAGNLQVAWEILELAVKIFEKQGEKGYENLTECYSELAGISFENSHFQEAINDYQKALAIHGKTDKIDLRLMAEINYKVGLCYLMLNNFDASIDSFRAAVVELEKVTEAEKAKEQTDETKETIKELVETKNDILEKILDVEEAKKTSLEEVKRELSKIIASGAGPSASTTNGAGPSSSSSSSSATVATNGSKSSTAPTATPTACASSGSSTAAKPANDISHLIKRKKPDSASSEESPAKKTATEQDNAERVS